MCKLTSVGGDRVSVPSLHQSAGIQVQGRTAVDATN